MIVMMMINWDNFHDDLLDNEASAQLSWSCCQMIQCFWIPHFLLSYSPSAEELAGSD